MTVLYVSEWSNNNHKTEPALCFFIYYIRNYLVVFIMSVILSTPVLKILETKYKNNIKPKTIQVKKLSIFNNIGIK